MKTLPFARHWTFSFLTALVCVAASFGAAAATELAAVSAEEALNRCTAGNQRFAAGKATHLRQDVGRCAEVSKSQAPFAVVVGCSDSRVDPAVVFDQGLGDLFVVRTAGHVVDDVALGSIEYAVEHLGAPLVLVLGHERCGAVAATVAGGDVPGHLAAVIDAIKPAVETVKGQPGDPVDNAVRANVHEVVTRLRHSEPILAERVTAGKLKVVGARYDLETGKVEPLD